MTIIAPNPGPQSLLLSCPYQDILYGGARGGGKSRGLLLDWLNHASIATFRARGLLVRRTLDELDELISQSEEIYPYLGGTWHASKKTWFFNNGARIRFRYLERDADAQRQQGYSHTWIGVDEAGAFGTHTPIDKLQATLRSPYGAQFVRGMCLTANPGGPGHGWIKDRYISPVPPWTPYKDETSGIHRIYIPARIEHNPYISNDDSYRDRLRASGPSWLVSAWLNGDWQAAPEGGIVKVEWFGRYSEAPKFDMLVQSWDCANKAKEINDYSVCTTWGINDLGYYLLHVFRGRLEYPLLKNKVKKLATEWNPNFVLIEDKGNGTALIQDMTGKRGLPFIPVEPYGDKVMRMVAETGPIEAGKVFLPQRASWLQDYEIELGVFNEGHYDDQVDSTSQFLHWARTSGKIIMPNLNPSVNMGGVNASQRPKSKNFTGIR